MPNIVPPVPKEENIQAEVWTLFHELLRSNVNAPRFYAKATDPTTTDVISGTWSIWENTTSGLTKLWLNYGGVMRSVTIS